MISDLHANLPALEAVLDAEPFDRLLIGGDLVSYGPHPREVIDLVRRSATAAVRGNHDDALARRVDCRCSPWSRPLAEATLAVHRELLSNDDLTFLGSLPLTVSLREGDVTFFVVHASPGDHLYSYALTPTASADRLRTEVESVSADCIVLGHTHLPMVRSVGAQVVVNPGSAGQPRDGDPGASYAVLHDGEAMLRRVAYDVDRTIRDLRALQMDPLVADRLAAILRSGET